MANIKLNIKIEIIDYWIKDTYELGKNNICYVLMKINNELSLKEIILNEN